MTSGQGGDPTIPKGVVQKGGEGGGGGGDKDELLPS